MSTAGTAARLEAAFGAGQAWTAPHGAAAAVWELDAYHLLWVEQGGDEVQLRSLWEARKGNRAYPVVLLAPAGGGSAALRVAGPQDARPLRELPAERVLELLSEAAGLPVRAAAALLAREFARLEESVLPGLRVKDLLTPHFVRERLRWAANAERLAGAAEQIGAVGSQSWRPLYEQLGYQVEQLPRRGYLLRAEGAPLAVVHPYSSAALFSRLTGNGELPEGLALADCAAHGARWALLTAEGRHRLFQRRPPIGAASGQYIELDAAELERGDRLYLGLLAPPSLREGGWLEGWIAEAKDFGEELRKGLEERLIQDALPNIARGLGAQLEAEGVDLNDRAQLRRIEAAALTLVFRFMFLLHTEARGYLPVDSAAYRPHSARKLADDSRRAPAQLDRRSTQRWDRLSTLVRMVRKGDRSAGVPAYNGSLFAPDGFPGGALLERAAIADVYLAPALAAIAYETDKPNAPGLDYAGLQIGHLGAIYEALLTLRLTRAPEDLAYDAKRDVFRPPRAGEQAAVTRAQLYYQAEAGGRKAAGVFYTRYEFVDHLLRHSLAPALDEHLGAVALTAKEDPAAAARRLFDFSVVDPAMGSAHFLTAALDMIADRIELFLAENGGLPAISALLSELTEEAAAAGPQPEDGDLLRRLILKRCIYGVDRSPMAVEVANVTLWLASFVPGLALSWLGSNLKCGDALIGAADAELVWQRADQRTDRPSVSLLTQPIRSAMSEAAQLQREIAATRDRNPGEVQTSELLDRELQEATRGLRDAFDLWTAEPLGAAGGRSALDLHAAEIVRCRPLPEQAAQTLERASDLAEQHRFLHWPLEFPQIFHRERPGFDVVAGNPPWNKVKFELPSFLALHDPGIRGLRSALERDARAERLFERRPELRGEIEQLKQQVELQRRFFRPQNGYTIQGSGDTDLYKLFCERYAAISRRGGRIGVVLPRAAFLNDGSRGFRRWFFKECRPNRIDAIVNRRRWAFDIHPQYTVALVSAQVDAGTVDQLVVTGPAQSAQEFAGSIASAGVKVNLQRLAAWTPAPKNDKVAEPTWEVPLVPTQRHVSVLAKLRRGVRVDRLNAAENRNPQFAAI